MNKSIWMNKTKQYSAWIARVIGLCVIFTLLFQTQVFAETVSTEATGAIISVETPEITLSQDLNNFNASLSVNVPANFAGAEFAIQCTDGVSIESTTYNVKASSAGPKLVDQLTWFTFFSGNNDFSGTATANVRMNYEGTENTVAVLERVTIYTKVGSSLQKETYYPRSPIVIKRAGANNEIVTPPQPDNTVDTPTGNPSAGSTTSETGSNDGVNINTGQTATSNNANNPPSNSATGTPPVLSRIGDNQTPLQGTTGNNNSIQALSESANSENPILWMLLGLCGGALLVLGFLWIKRKRKAEKVNVHIE